MRQRVTEARVARLGTVDAGGRPHLVPCCFALDGDELYSPIDDVKPKSTRRLRRLDNIRAHPEVSILVDHYEEDWSVLWWIRLDGVAEILDRGAARHDTGTRLLGAKYAQYRPGSLDGPLIAMRIERWRAWP